MKKINETELKQLFQEYQVNKESGYQKLYEHYHTLVYGIVFSMVRKREIAEDIMQEVFLKIWKMSPEQLPKSYPASWLYTVTKNEVLAYIRKTRPTISLEDIYEMDGEDVQIEKQMDEQTYQKLISYLNEEERQIVSLKIRSDLPFREIAQLLQMPIGTVQWKYYKALHSLKLWIGNLSMFLITSVLLIGNLLKGRKKQTQDMQEISKESTTNDTISEDTTINSQESLENQKQNQQEQHIEEKETETSQTTVVTSDSFDITTITLISINTIFFILTIFFTIIFLKHQQNKKKRASKG